jgi:hypothetical protein
MAMLYMETSPCTIKNYIRQEKHKLKLLKLAKLFVAWQQFAQSRKQDIRLHARHDNHLRRASVKLHT